MRLDTANDFNHHLNWCQNYLKHAGKLIDKGKSGQRQLEEAKEVTEKIKALIKINIAQISYHDDDLFSFTFDGRATTFYVKDVAFYADDKALYEKAIRGVQAADHLRELNRLTAIANKHYESAKSAKCKGQEKRAKRLYDLANDYYQRANKQQNAYRVAKLDL